MEERLSIAEVKRAFEAVAAVFEREYADEPMPSFDTHDPAKLGGALAAPFQSAFGEDIYPTVYLKAAATFYFVANDHAFENGNKRTAVIVLLYFLAKNELALQIHPKALYEMAVMAVESEKDEQGNFIGALAEVIDKNCIPFGEWLEKRNRKSHGKE